MVSKMLKVGSRGKREEKQQIDMYHVFSKLGTVIRVGNLKESCLTFVGKSIPKCHLGLAPRTPGKPAAPTSLISKPEMKLSAKCPRTSNQLAGIRIGWNMQRVVFSLNVKVGDPYGYVPLVCDF